MFEQPIKSAMINEAKKTKYWPFSPFPIQSLCTHPWHSFHNQWDGCLGWLGRGWILKGPSSDALDTAAVASRSGDRASSSSHQRRKRPSDKSDTKKKGVSCIFCLLTVRDEEVWSGQRKYKTEHLATTFHIVWHHVGSYQLLQKVSFPRLPTVPVVNE